MEWYKLDRMYGYKIVKVEVEKETEKCVWINGNKNVKSSAYYLYVPTLEEAKRIMTDRLRRDKNTYEIRLALIEERLRELTP